MRKRQSRQKLLTAEKGLVSFFVVAIILVVISLVVISFSRIVRREQVQTSDRQFSTQAFYAAETGINDAAEFLNNNPGADGWGSDCNGSSSFIDYAGLTTSSQLDGEVAYTCLLVDKSPSELTYSNVPINSSLVTPINPATADIIDRIVLSWDDINDLTDISNCPVSGVNSLPGRLPGGCEVGGMRVELVPFDTPKNRTELMNERFVTYLQPLASGSSSISYGSGTGDNTGVKESVECDTAIGDGFCEISITGLPGGENEFYIRLRSLYKPTKLSIKALDSSGNVIPLEGSQVAIDATGRAGGVLRRIRVTRPVAKEGFISPEFALKSFDPLCKRYLIAPGDPAGASDFVEYWDGWATTSSECDLSL